MRQVCESVNKNEQEIIKFCLDSRNKIGKAETTQITGVVKKIVQAVTDLGLQLSVLHGRLVEVKESKGMLESTIEANTLSILGIVSQSKQSELQREKPTFASILTSKKFDKTLKADNSVVVFPLDKTSGKNPEDMHTDLKKVLNPVAEGIKITSTRKLGTKGLLIRTEEKQDLNALLESPKFKDLGLSVSRPTKKMPRLALYGVPSEMTSEEIGQSLIKLNKLEESEVNDQLKFIFKFGKRDQITTNHVIQVSPELRKKLIKLGKIFLGWSCCRVEDHIQISRCYKCNGFGHVGKFCKQTSSSCSHCSGDHDVKDCQKKNEAPCCVNCKRFKLQHEHAASDRNCPSYLNALSGLINKTEYGI